MQTEEIHLGVPFDCHYCGWTKSCTTVKPSPPLFRIFRGIRPFQSFYLCELDFVHSMVTQALASPEGDAILCFCSPRCLARLLCASSALQPALGCEWVRRRATAPRFARPPRSWLLLGNILHFYFLWFSGGVVGNPHLTAKN